MFCKKCNKSILCRKCQYNEHFTPLSELYDLRRLMVLEAACIERAPSIRSCSFKIKLIRRWSSVSILRGRLKGYVGSHYIVACCSHQSLYYTAEMCKVARPSSFI